MEPVAAVAAAAPRAHAASASASGSNAANAGSAVHLWTWHTAHSPAPFGNAHTAIALTCADNEDI